VYRVAEKRKAKDLKNIIEPDSSYSAYVKFEYELFSLSIKKPAENVMDTSHLEN
jgi:hypothetical protein